MLAWRSPLILILPLVLPACHIMEKADQCTALSDLMKQAEPKLAPQLPKDPSAQALEHKALLYLQLSDQLKKSKVSNNEVSKQRDLVAAHLSGISQHLSAAASAVDSQEKDRSRAVEQEKDRSRAVEREKERRREQLGGAPNRGEDEFEKGVEQKADKQPKPSPKVGEPTKRAPKRSAIPRRTRPPREGAQHGIRYRRAKKAIESESGKLRVALQSLESACR